MIQLHKGVFYSLMVPITVGLTLIVVSFGMSLFHNAGLAVIMDELTGEGWTAFADADDNFDVPNELEVGGDIIGSGSGSFAGNVDIGGNLEVDGTTTLNDDVDVDGLISGDNIDIDTTASGNTIGRSNCSASGLYSLAIGEGTTANQQNAFAGGISSTASGNISLAFGDTAVASGNTSISMGRNSTASGDYSTAIGFNTTASGNYSFASGIGTTASGLYSSAFGSASTGSGSYAIAIGSGNIAGGDYSFACGFDNVATGANSTTLGNNGDSSGIGSTTLGSGATASGDNSLAGGDSTTASGDNSTAFGYATTASGTSSTTFGHYTEANGIMATAIGREIIVDGDYSVGIALNDQNSFIVHPDNVMSIMGGNVGIGTGTPTATLEVNGNVIISGTLTANVFDSKYAEMTMYDASQVITINTANTYHAVMGYSAGSLNDWTFNAGRVVDADITSEADNTVLRIVTSGAHSLANGDVITCTDMNNAGHNGVTVVTVIDATTFDCDDINYIAGAGVSSGVIDEPSYLEAGSDSTGVYSCGFSISGLPAGINKTYKWEIYVNSDECDNVVGEHKHAIADIVSISSSGVLVSITPNDRVWLAIEGVTDTTDFTIEHSNINLHKL